MFSSVSGLSRARSVFRVASRRLYWDVNRTDEPSRFAEAIVNSRRRLFEGAREFLPTSGAVSVRRKRKSGLFFEAETRRPNRRRLLVVSVCCKRKSGLFFEAEAKRPNRRRRFRVGKAQKISAFPGGDFGGPDFPPSSILENVPTSRCAKRRRFVVESATSVSVRVSDVRR